MERKVFEDNLYALEERFKAYDRDMHRLLADIVGEKGMTLVALEAQDAIPTVYMEDTFNNTTYDAEVRKIYVENNVVFFEDRDGDIYSENRMYDAGNVYPLLSIIRDELKAREGIKI